TPASVTATEGKENAPLLPPRPYQAATMPTPTATSQARSRADIFFPTISPSPSSHSPTHPAVAEPYTITLIRRDPPTGAQWTIGSLLISPRSTPSVVITLTTPGYTAFSNPPGEFRREINTDKPVTAVRRRGHRRGHSAFSTHSSDQTSLPHPQPKEAQAYTFPSPWSTPCTFATAPSGRALRCTHELPAVDSEGEPTVEGVVAWRDEEDPRGTAWGAATTGVTRAAEIGAFVAIERAVELSYAREFLGWVLGYG
ncbi:hypothetical protein V493_03010, partial [Pseudogymnoascus sp. VKM F-4281 (FW-2241)]